MNKKETQHFQIHKLEKKGILSESFLNLIEIILFSSYKKNYYLKEFNKTK